MTAALQRESGAVVARQALIDCDVHNTVPSVESLFPLCRLPASSASRSARFAGGYRRNCRHPSSSDGVRVEASLNGLVQSAAGAASPPES